MARRLKLRKVVAPSRAPTGMEVVYLDRSDSQIKSVNDVGDVLILEGAVGGPSTAANVSVAAPLTGDVQSVLEGGLRSVTVSLSSAQILALFTTPIQLVAAPGAGKLVMPSSALAKLNAGATPYDATGLGGLYIGVDPGDGDWLSVTGGADEILMASAVDAIAWFGSVATGEGFPLTTAENQPVLIGFADANPTAGNGTLDVTVYYVVVDV